MDQDAGVRPVGPQGVFVLETKTISKPADRDVRVVFDGGPGTGPATRLLLDLMAFDRRPDLRNPRPWVSGMAPAGVTALAVRSLRHHHAAGNGSR